jgi:hypothetical protein
MRRIVSGFIEIFLMSLLISNAQAGSLTVESGTSENYVEVSNNPVAKAKTFLKKIAHELKLRGDLSDLKIESVTESPVGYHVRFQQMKGKLSVHHSGLTVTVNRRNHDVAYQSNYHETDLGEDAPAFSIPASRALKIAFENAKLTSSPAKQTIVQKVEVIDGVSRPVYEIRFSAPLDKKYAWETVMDGETGVIYQTHSLIANDHPEQPVFGSSQVSAQVFDPNPTIASNLNYGAVSGFRDDNNADSDFFDSVLKPTSIGVTLYQGLYYLAGKYAVITDQELPKNPDCSTKNPEMKYRRGDACFDSVNAFYHVTKSLAYLNETLGISAHPRLYAGPVHVDPAGVSGSDESHYNPVTDELALGVEGVHDAEDHDVILHELGHAIHNWVTNGHMSQVEGLSEGIGDYWAASYARTQMKPDNVAYNWVMSFDGHNEYWQGRVVNVDLQYPAGVRGEHSEIHDAGQLWSTTCMEIWSAIGKEKMDRIFWAGIAMLGDNSSQLDAAKAVYAAAKEMYPQDQNLIDTVKQKFLARGYTL